MAGLRAAIVPSATVGMVAAYLAHRYDAFERFSGFNARYERLLLDETIIFLVVALAVGSLSLLRRWRRERTLRHRLQRAYSLQLATLEATADGIIVFDGNLRIIDWNDKAREMLGVLPECDGVDGLQSALTTALATATNGTSVVPRDERFSDVLGLPDGRVVERYVQPQHMDGEVDGSVWSLRDVTRRERAIAEARVLASHFEGAFGAAPIGMCLISSEDGRWHLVNSEMCRLLGRTRGELIGRDSQWITHPEERAATDAWFRELRSGTRRTVQVEKRYIHKDGSEIWTIANATRINTEGGGSEYIVSQVQDITERRRQDIALRRQAIVFDTISDAVILCDGEGNIVDANPVVTAIFGYERDELLGQTPRLWQTADETLYGAIRESLRVSGFWTGEYGFVSKDGRTGIVESTVKVLRAADGSIVNTVGVMRDVTERREMERHQLQSQKLEAIGSLASGIAHEINTPTQYVGDNLRFLGAGIASLGLLTESARALADAARALPELNDVVAAFDRVVFDIDVDYLLAELPPAAEQSGEGCERIAEIVQAMKRFSHPGTSKPTLVDLNELVCNTITVSRNEWRYVAELTTDLDPSLPHVACFPGEYQQVVLNLVVNAAHAISTARAGTGELGHITISSKVSAGWVELRVADDGCGIPLANFAKVFDPFFTTKKVGQGTGQGLSISHATIVGKHHGTLTFESTPGCGTTFIIRLPLDWTLTSAAAAA